MTNERQPELPNDGPSAPPRRNGELIFDEPWESRAFGMAMVLHQSEVYHWSDFSRRLGREIGAGEAAPSPQQVLPVAPDTETRYYERWLASLEALLIERGLLSAEEIEQRTSEFAAGLWEDH